MLVHTLWGAQRGIKEDDRWGLRFSVVGEAAALNLKNHTVRYAKLPQGIFRGTVLRMVRPSFGREAFIPDID